MPGGCNSNVPCLWKSSHSFYKQWRMLVQATEYHNEENKTISYDREDRLVRDFWKLSQLSRKSANLQKLKGQGRELCKLL